MVASIRRTSRLRKNAEASSFWAGALPANPEAMNTDLSNQWLGLCSWIPGPALKGRPGMTAELFRTLLVSLVTAFPALAQTTAVPGGVTRNGIVTLGTGSSALAAPTYANPTTSTPSTPGTTAAASGTSSVAGVASGGGAAGNRSTTLGGTGAAPSARAASGGSAGSATTAPASGAPAWVVCPPPGALGTQPFVAGTDLSCAP